MEIIEDHHARKATIIASQLPVSTWFDVFPEATVADAILDRIAHTSHRIELKGDSLRKNGKFVMLNTNNKSKTGCIWPKCLGGYHRNIQPT